VSTSDAAMQGVHFITEPPAIEFSVTADIAGCRTCNSGVCPRFTVWFMKALVIFQPDTVRAVYLSCIRIDLENIVHLTIRLDAWIIFFVSFKFFPNASPVFC
jgi:hypothetical protein